MNIKRLISISRPRFWIYELGPYIVGIAAALSTMVNPDFSVWYSIPVIVFFIFFMYPANSYIYGINDIYDYETDKLNPKKVAYESLVMPAEHKKLFIHIALVCIPFFIYGMFTLSFATLCAFLAFFFFAGFYSAKPIRAKARPFLDSTFSAGHYVATGVFSYLLITDIQNLPVNITALIVSTIAGLLWAISMRAYSAVPDIKADRDAKLETIATILEKKNTILLCLAFYALSGILVFPYIGVVSLALALVYVFFMYRSLKTTEEELFKVYTYFPTINSLSGMIIFFTLLLS